MLGNSSIDKIGVFVSNYKKALIFYKDILKLKAVWESEEGKNAGFRVGSNLLIIQEDKKQVKSGGPRLYFTVRDIERVRQKLVKKQVDCSQVKDYGDFKLVNFADEDENRFGLMEPVEAYIPIVEEYLNRKLSIRNKRIKG